MGIEGIRGVDSTQRVNPVRSIYPLLDSTQRGNSNASDTSFARRKEAIERRDAVDYARVCNEYGLTPEVPDLYSEGLALIESEGRETEANTLVSKSLRVGSLEQKRRWLREAGVEYLSVQGVGPNVPLKQAEFQDICKEYNYQLDLQKRKAGILPINL